MPNKNYIKGRRKEYKICKQLKEKGYDIVQRSAGSHSPVDIFAINSLTKTIKLIQAKPDNYGEKQVTEIYLDNKLLHGLFEVYFEVI